MIHSTVFFISKMFWLAQGYNNDSEIKVMKSMQYFELSTISIPDFSPFALHVKNLRNIFIETAVGKYSITMCSFIPNMGTIAQFREVFIMISHDSPFAFAIALLLLEILALNYKK